MKVLFLLIHLILSFKLTCQNNPDGSIDFDNITKPGDIYYTPSEKLALDSFTIMVEEYKRLEKQIIKKMTDDSIRNVLKQNYINQYICNFAYSIDDNLYLITRLIKKDLLLFPRSRKFKGSTILDNCVRSLNVRKLIADYIITKDAITDCNFFNDLNFYYENTKFSYDLKLLNETKASIRQMNINCIADLLRDYEPEFRKVVADQYANDCYRENAKLMLEYLDKNK